MMTGGAAASSSKGGGEMARRSKLRPLAPQLAGEQRSQFRDFVRLSARRHWKANKPVTEQMYKVNIWVTKNTFQYIVT